jgi:hypothetical protein
VDALLDCGWNDLTVLAVSAAGLHTAQNRLGRLLTVCSGWQLICSRGSRNAGTRPGTIAPSFTFSRQARTKIAIETFSRPPPQLAPWRSSDLRVRRPAELL